MLDDAYFVSNKWTGTEKAAWKKLTSDGGAIILTNDLQFQQVRLLYVSLDVTQISNAVIMP